MKNKKITIASFLLAIVLAVSCAEEKKEETSPITVVQQPINPNGDSELALLMREMFEEAQLLKEQIENGEPIEININHAEILTANATEPEKVASPEYKVFADAYLQSIINLQSATTKEVDSLYGTMVVNCMACHQVICPGPMAKIKKLQ